MGCSPNTGSRFYAGATLTRKEVFRYIFWEWIEPIGSALGIALLVMHFVMALYVIPTGSMQPTLHGANDYGTGDKVMVNKFIYRFQEPERWDVIVFDYPYKSITCDRCGVDASRDFPTDVPEVLPAGLVCHTSTCQGLAPDFSFVEKEYIKRCVGIPGDELSVRDGNIVIRKEGQSWKPSVKTRVAQEALWVSAFDSEEDMSSATYFWKGNDSLLNQWATAQRPTLKPSEKLLLFMEKDRLRGYGDQSKPAPQGRGFEVPLCGDVALELSFDAMPTSGTLELDLSRNLVSHKLDVDLAKKTWKVSVAGVTQGKGSLGSDLSLLRFARVDGHVQLLLNDEIQRWMIPEFNDRESTKTMVPKLRYSGSADFNLDRLRILRDIYYVNTGHEFLRGEEQSYKIRLGEYFAMGDNSFFSYDSRGWGPVRAEKLIGKALVVLFPPSRAKFIY